MITTEDDGVWVELEESIARHVLSQAPKPRGNVALWCADVIFYPENSDPNIVIKLFHVFP